MKKIFVLLGVLLVMSSCSSGYTKVPAGYEGVKINTLGTDKSDLTIVGVGRQFYNPYKYEIELFPLFKQNYVWTADSNEQSTANESITFQSKESLTFNADVGISYQVNRGYSDKLFETYRKGVEEITDVDMRNSVRDAFNRLGSKRSVEGIYGEGKADFIAAVQADVAEYWEPSITVHKIYLVGEMRPPKAVKNAIAAKIEATQIAQQRRNEVEQTKAEADKKIAKARGDKESAIMRAEGEAKAIALIERQLSKSPRYIEYIKVNKWNGELPQIVGSSAIPMINMKGD